MEVSVKLRAIFGFKIDYARLVNSITALFKLNYNNNSQRGFHGICYTQHINLPQV